MYKTSVPIYNTNIVRCDREEILKQLKRFDAERVFLALDRYELDETKKTKALKELRDNCEFFKNQGFEVGAWIWTFWIAGNKNFRNMRSIKGTEISEFICPTDSSFVDFASDYIKDIANCGVDIIMFDDDFRYGFLSDSPACLCDGHIEIINNITGEKKSRGELCGFITTGKKNKFRDAYLKANGDAFRNFAKRMRNAVDEINPSVRMGACACLTSWDIDGVEAKELSKILAGSTKPFVRLIGAPYWAVNKSWGNMLQDVIELERMESSWTKDADIEIMAEGDGYPRPRTLCPANYIEGFDTAIRASGCTDGILKYGIDYYSNADYEMGYAKFHERNREVYTQIDEIFGGKTPCGIRVYETKTKVSDMVLPTKVNNDVDIQDFFFSKAARSLAYNTIPTVYEGCGICGIAFDENARHLPAEAFSKGLIIDIAAAEILMKHNVDVGIERLGKATTGFEEHFLDDNNHILSQGATVYDIKLNEQAEILSDIETPLGKIPVSYRYENSKGQRFLVLNINTRFGSDNLLKHYARSRQYAVQVKWLSGQAMPAYAYGNPALYMQCKQSEKAMAVGLWNFFADIAIEPIIELSKKWTEIKFINCSGQLEGNKVYLSDIPAFGFAAFEVR